MDNESRNQLGQRTLRALGFQRLRCGHAVRLDFLHDERCPFCADYEESRVFDELAARRDRAELSDAT